MKSKVFVVAASLAAVAALPAVPAAAQQALGGQAPVSGSEALAAKAGAQQIRVIVKLKEPQPSALRAAGLSYAQAVQKAQDAVARDVFGATPAGLGAQGRGMKLYHVAAQMSLSVTADEIRKLAQDPRVDSVVEDAKRYVSLVQSLKLVNSPGAYQVNAKGNGRAVAIVDTGVNKNHEFLSGKVIAEACYTSNVPADGATARCPGGATSSTAPGSAADCDAATAHGCGHGTHVAGIAAGSNTSLSTGEPVRGVAGSASIVAINVFSMVDAAHCNGAACVLSYDSDMDLALQHVYDLKTAPGGPAIDAVNMSIGGTPYTTGTCDAEPQKPFIDALRAVGVATVISAGNDYIVDAVSPPGCISTAITVGASSKKSSTKAERVAVYSNLNAVVDTLAPGGDVNYPFKAAKDYILSSSGAGYVYMAGTSMAAPHVTGAIAAIRSRAKCSTKTVSQIETAFRKTGLLIKDWRRVSGVTPTSKRRLDMVAVMKYLNCY